MNEFDEVINSYKSLKERTVPKMFKNEQLEITPLQNGYLVEYSYRVIADKDAKDSFDKYEYVREKSMFKTWDEVIDFVSKTKLETPPAKIN